LLAPFRWLAGLRPDRTAASPRRSATLRCQPEKTPFFRVVGEHLGEPLEPQPVSPARGPPIDWAELVQAHDDRDIIQVSPDKFPVIDIRSL